MDEDDYIKFLESIKCSELILAGVESKECGVLSGMVFGEQNSQHVSTTTVIPHTLFPTPLSSVYMTKAKQLQLAINMLIYVMGRDEQFILDSLKGSAKNDHFTAGLLDILRATKTEQFPQLATAAILRTDYMIDHDSSSPHKEHSLKQIEMNTISVAYGAHSSSMAILHRNTLYCLLQTTKDSHQRAKINNYLKCIPTNDTLVAYDENKQMIKELPAIVFAVQAGEKNKYDQLKIFYMLRSEFVNAKSLGIPPIFVLTLDELVEKLELDKELGILTLKCPNKSTKHEVAVVYFRSCYGPDDFASDKVWNMRKLIEMSKAIKLPDIRTHLVGFKKFQQILACNHALTEKYLEKATELCPAIANVTSKDIIDTFATFYSLDPQEVDVVEVTRLVKKNVEDYVLKPQREGGGNNLYGKEMVGAITEKLKNGSLSDYIIMSLIHPKIYTNYKIVESTDRPVQLKTIAELGIFGHFIVDSAEMVLSNEVNGHLVRTKASKTKDGGVSSGNAVLDSPIIF